MTKKRWIILVSIVVILTLLISYTVWSNNLPQEETNEAVTIWQLVDKMDSLRDLKAECADNLWIKDSAKFLMWETWYCDSWDAEIIELRNQISEYQKKDYETAKGLIKSRKAQ
jgi:hypothetical protein